MYVLFGKLPHTREEMKNKKQETVGGRTGSDGKRTSLVFSEKPTRQRERKEVRHFKLSALFSSPITSRKGKGNKRGTKEAVE